MVDRCNILQNIGFINFATADKTTKVLVDQRKPTDSIVATKLQFRK